MKKLVKIKKSPNFKIVGTSNKIIELNKIKSKFIVLYFYPKDDTPGCTLETKDFNSLLYKFKKKYGVKFELLADEKKEAIKAYKVWGKKKFMGMEFTGIIRSTFLIKDKKIIKDWKSVRVKGHAQEVLDFIENF